MNSKSSKKNSSCKYNNFDLDDNPIDDNTLKSINPENIYVLDDKCYDKNSIREILYTSKVNPSTGKQFKQSVYEDFNIENIHKNEKYNELDLNNYGLEDSNLFDYDFNDYNSVILDNNNLNTLGKFDRLNYDNTIIYLSASNNHIVFNLGDTLPKYIKTLILNNNKIRLLNDIKFPNTLEDLELSGNLIESLLNINFSINLLSLNLSNNKIKSLNNVTFPKSLLDLNLSQNEINSLNNLRLSIEKINLSHNNINSLEYVTFSQGIKFLDLSNNKISENTYMLKINFPSSLIRLNLSNNKITNLRDFNFNRELKDLRLSDNLISSLKNINFNDFLIKLDLSNNYITSIDSNIIIFPNSLEELNLYQNNIISILKFDIPTNLRILDLRSNNIPDNKKLNDNNVKIIYDDFDTFEKYSNKIKNKIPNFQTDFYL